MKRENILKLIIVLIMGVLLVVMSTRVFALDDTASGIDLFENQNTNTNIFEDQTDELNTSLGTNTNTTNTTNTNTNTKVNTNTNNNYNTNLPAAGAKENTMLGVAITVLSITAIYAYKKVKEYKNI